MRKPAAILQPSNGTLVTPIEFTQQQIERYRQMTGEQRLLIGLNLHELSCEVARDGIRGRFPNATPELVEAKLRERLRQTYQSNDTTVGPHD